MKLKGTFFLICMLGVLAGFGQPVGGETVFKSLGMSPSARITALGLRLITVSDEDVLLAFDNPAVAGPEAHKQIGFHHNFYPGGIGHGSLAVGYHEQKLNLFFHAGMRYINYGDIPEADIYGQKTGRIPAGEWMARLGVAKPLSERWRMGLALNYLNARLDRFTSNAIGADVGFFYSDTASNITLALVAKNLGTTLKTFTGGPKKKLPSDVSAGISKRLAHLPFRVTATMHHINKWNITYDDPNQKDETTIIGSDAPKESKFGKLTDNFFRHMIFSGEFLLGRHEQFRLRLGYNHLLHKELAVKGLRSFSGFTTGFGIRIKRFRLDYGFANYHFGGKAHHLAISSHF